jgi:hypothetical protein
LYDCANPDKGHKDANWEPDPCHFNDSDGGTDGGTDAGGEPSCEVGEFVHWSHGWDSPSWVWIGPEDQAPECPQGPTSISYEGRTDLVASPVCEVCTCEPPTGSCALPSTLTASTAVCGTPGATTSFNAPSLWNGSCDGSTQVPGGAAQSLTIDPLVMTETGCASGPPVAAKIVSLHWETFARACDVGLPKTLIERSTCLPADPIAPGFKACIFSDSEMECPNEHVDNVFTEQHVFYHGVQDARQCSACTCGAPTGSVCKGQVSIYDGNDLTCGGPALDQKSISSAKPACLDLTIPGQSLGSKSAGPTTYVPGACPPGGGVASGTAIPTIPMTVCCRP